MRLRPIKLPGIVCAFLLTIALSGEVNGQLFQGLPAGKSASPDSSTIAEQRAKTETQLAETQRQRESESRGPQVIANAEAVRAADRQRLLDFLTVQQGEKIKRLDELAELQKMPQPSLAAMPSVRALGDHPPYSALAVDALREEHDELGEKIRTLSASIQIKESEKQSFLDELRRADEALRLSNDRLAMARDGKEQTVEKGNQEQAELRRRVAETILAVAALDEERLRLQLSRLNSQSEEMQRLIVRVLPDQRLSEQDLEELRQRILVSQKRLAEETAKLRDSQRDRKKEQSRLLSQLPSPDSAAGQRLARLDRMLAIDGVVDEGLSRLEMLYRIEGEVWEKYQLALSGENQESRRQAVASLTKLYQDLRNRKRFPEEQLVTARAEIRVQEALVANLRPDSPELNGEREILRLLKEISDVYERLALGAGRLERRLARWNEDFARAGEASLKGQVGRIGEELRAVWRAVWQYELFSVEDVSEVDGRKLTVTYGVTVGKSVGALLLFAAGYWLFSLLSLYLQRILTNRFGISSHQASVIRRWLMILLALGLIVFILNLARIPLTVFAFMGGALAIGVGFGIQTIVKNVISGIIILFERKIRVGDIVEVGDMTGHVTAVDLRATTVRGFNGVEALVPNSNFLEQQVVNWTYTNQRIRRELRIGVAYGTDSLAAEAIFMGAANDHPKVLKTPVTEVYFEDFTDSALLMVLVFWVELGPDTDTRRVASDLRHTIYRRMAEAGMEIPFQQRDVHLDLAQPLPVSIVAGGNGS